MDENTVRPNKPAASTTKLVIIEYKQFTPNQFKTQKKELTEVQLQFNFEAIRTE